MIKTESAYEANFFIILFDRAFKMMKNGIYFIVIAPLVLSYSRFWFMQIRWLVTSFCGHKVM